VYQADGYALCSQPNILLEHDTCFWYCRILIGANMSESGAPSDKHTVDQKTGFRDVAARAETPKTDKSTPGGIVEKVLEAVEPGKGQAGKVMPTLQS
jgi:hypothetical protein